jgi:phosphatidylglycerophosphatase A
MSAATPRARAPLWATLVATGLGSGYSPVASGTAGTAACAAIVWLARGALSHPAIDLAACVLMTLAAVAAAEKVARAVGQKDPKIVVADEFAGYLVTMALLPKTLPWLTAGFLVFRVLDVWKPPPCRRLELVRGGWGITLDDVAAGIYGCLLLHLARVAIGA